MEIPGADRIVNEEVAVRRLIGRSGNRSALRCWYGAGPGVMSCTGCGPRLGGVPGGGTVADPEEGSDKGKTDLLTERPDVSAA